MSVMKKLLYTIVSTALLFAVTLGVAGGASDPLVSRRWLENEYRATLVTELRDATKQVYANQLLALTSRIDSGTPLLAPQGYKAAPANGNVDITLGQTLNLAQGAAFSARSGDAEVIVLSGKVLSLTDGTEMPAAFTPTMNHRYFVAEGSQATVTTQLRATLAVDGYILVEGEALTHHPAFKDVPIGAWYYAAVDFAYTNKMFSGTGEDTFSPNTAMTRGMFVTVLGRMAGVDPAQYAHDAVPEIAAPEATYDYDEDGNVIEVVAPPAAAQPRFSDVKDTAYFAPYVRWASENSIVMGYADGTFKPDTEVTREQMAALMYRYELWLGTQMNLDASVAQAFPDYDKVATWAQESVQWAVANKVINGSDGKLMPQNTATRAQVAQIMMNYKQR